MGVVARGGFWKVVAIALVVMNLPIVYIITVQSYFTNWLGDRCAAPHSSGDMHDWMTGILSLVKCKSIRKGVNHNPAIQPMRSKEETNTRHDFTFSYSFIFYASLNRAQVVLVGYYIF